MKTAKEDYRKEIERQAYCSGVVAHINGMSFTDNPYPTAAKELHLAWVRGFNETSSIKDKTR